MVGVPGCAPGLDPPHGPVLLLYYTPIKSHFYIIYTTINSMNNGIRPFADSL